MHFDYGLDTRPPVLRSLVLGLQWAVIATSLVIILGKVAAGAHLPPGEEIGYLQKLFFVTAAAALVQVFWGHRLPVISGPATTLLLGVLSSQGASAATVYTTVAAGGLLLAALSITGLFGVVRRLFTRRVVAVVLLLIAFTLAPTIQRLMIDAGGGAPPVANLVFALCLVTAMFLLHRRLAGFWKSTLIVWSMLAGSLAYFALLGRAAPAVGAAPLLRGFITGMTTRPSLEVGVLLSFFFCYLALAVNDIGAIQAMGPLLNPGGMDRRITRGMTLTGLSNILAGFFGVIGVVNFSLSAGVVVSTACASQFALVPGGLLLLLLSFSPAVIQLLGSVPSVVIGCVLLYVLTSQFASGLLLAFQKEGDARFELEDGIVIGLPVILGTVMAFLPAEVVATFPAALRPTLGNGFVVGVAGALLLEHLLFRRRVRDPRAAPGP